ncbi:lrr receptor-like serine/threonine-protein kinase-related [Anaeramoeba flamelloides]|uniref:Lrr receptor-like serine/threonine-protein kinase-related n=1 Tax=Anaeramoeba flamelloides TaxID=1746091 RepID=A0ABQ8XDF0_9EUKA|nr:lrr receptor-like serine/threonine-protein kinase-related [Anaeramoeba flamelloides]
MRQQLDSFLNTYTSANQNEHDGPQSKTLVEDFFSSFLQQSIEFGLNNPKSETGIYQQGNMVNHDDNYEEKVTIQNASLRNNSRTFEILDMFYDSLQGQYWSKSDGWKDHDTCFCEWYGISCNVSDCNCSNETCFIDSIQLDWNGLSGPIPDEFTELIELKELNLNFNSLDKLPETIYELKQLERLEIGYCSLTSLPSTFGMLESLNYLDVESNKLENLPDNFGNLTSLIHLSLRSNKLFALTENFGNLKNLNKLYLEQNFLEQLPESFGDLINAQSIWLTSNDIITLPTNIGNLISIENLYLENNLFTELPESFENLTNLKILKLTSNRLSEININFSKLINLQDLSLAGNSLSTLPNNMKYLKNLTDLKLSYNNFRKIPECLLYLNNLKTLKFENNLLEVLPDEIGKLYNLESFTLSDNNLYSLPDSFSDLKKLSLLYFNNNNFEQFPVIITQLTNVVLIDFENNKIKTIENELGNLNNLIQLNLNSNFLTTLPNSISNLTQLYRLKLRNNIISRLPDSISGLISLNYLDLSYNQLSELPESVSDLYEIYQIKLDFNQLTKLPERLSNLTSLYDLYLNYNNLKELPNSITQLTSLQTLEMNNNEITNINEKIGNLKKLKYLSLSNNLIENLPSSFCNLVSLKTLNLNNNEIINLPTNFGYLKNLEELDLSSNEIYELVDNFSNLTKLEIINLSFNQINKLNNDTSFNNLMTGVTQVNLESNQIEQLPYSFFQLFNLKNLNLANNDLETFPLELNNFLNLQQLTLKGNKKITTIHSNFFSLIKLQYIDLSNCSIGGPLSFNFVYFTKLKTINLSSNKFTGTITRISFNSDFLTSIDLSYNQLTGEFDDSFLHIGQIHEIYADGNNIETISTQVSTNCETIFVISLSHNNIKQHIGEIENKFDECTMLKTLNLGYNQIYGSMNKNSFKGSSHLEDIILTSNFDLGGDFPDLLNSNYLRLVDFSNTEITGGIPEEWGFSSRLSIVNLTNIDYESMYLPSWIEKDFYNWFTTSSDSHMLCPKLVNKRLSTTSFFLNNDFDNYDGCVCENGYFRGKFGKSCIKCQYGCDCQQGQIENCYPSPNLDNPQEILNCAILNNNQTCNLKIPSTIPITENNEQYEFGCKNGYSGRLCSECYHNSSSTYYSVGQKKQNKKSQQTLSINQNNINQNLLSSESLSSFSSKQENDEIGLRIKESGQEIGGATESENEKEMGNDKENKGEKKKKKDPDNSFSEDTFSLDSNSNYEKESLLIDEEEKKRRKEKSLKEKREKKKLEEKQSRIENWKYICIYINLFLFTVIYLPVSCENIRIFGCSLKGYDNIKYLNSIPYYQCSPITKNYKAMLVLSIFGFFLWVIGIPLTVYLFVSKGAKYFEKDKLSIITGFLVGPFKEKFWWWFMIDLARKLCLSVFDSIVPFYSENKIIFIYFTFQISILLQHVNRPYTTPIKNFLCLLSFYSTFLSYFLKLLINLLEDNQYQQTKYVLSQSLKIKTVLVILCSLILYIWIYREQIKKMKNYLTNFLKKFKNFKKQKNYSQLELKKTTSFQIVNYKNQSQQQLLDDSNSEEYSRNDSNNVSDTTSDTSSEIIKNKLTENNK